MISESKNKPSLSEVLTYGAVRSTVLSVALYPLEVVKSHQQVSDRPTTISQAGKALYSNKGFSGFYAGLSPYLMRNLVKQTIWWPAVVYIPPELKKRNFSSIAQHIITGTSAAAVDAAINAPFEKRRVNLSLSNNSETGIKAAWSGAIPYFKRQAVAWSLFLIGQDHLGRRYKRESCDIGDNRRLTMSEVVKVSLEFSILSNLLVAPFDTSNTLAQNSNKKETTARYFKKLNFSLTHMKSRYKGLPLNIALLFVNIIPTVNLINFSSGQEQRED